MGGDSNLYSQHYRLRAVTNRLSDVKAQPVLFSFVNDCHRCYMAHNDSVMNRFWLRSMAAVTVL